MREQRTTADFVVNGFDECADFGTSPRNIMSFLTTTAGRNKDHEAPLKADGPIHYSVNQCFACSFIHRHNSTGVL